MFNSFQQGIRYYILLLSSIHLRYWFLFCRLDPIADADDMQLIKDLFAGGESRRMGLNSIAVRIDDSSVSQHLPDTFQSLQSGNHNVSVRVFQSFQAGQLLSKEGMDAVLQLFINRDQQMCEAYAQVNEKSQGMFHDPRAFL